VAALTLAPSPHTTSFGFDAGTAAERSDEPSDAPGTTRDLVEVLRETARKASGHADTAPGTPASAVAGQTTDRSDGAEMVEKTTALDQALAALKQVALGTADEAGWMQAERLLRQAALERKYGSPRVASAALVVSDALMFTEIGHVRDRGLGPLRVALRTLTQPFVSEDDEAGMFRGFLNGGWYSLLRSKPSGSRSSCPATSSTPRRTLNAGRATRLGKSGCGHFLQMTST
jgi:hypothetical protein